MTKIARKVIAVASGKGGVGKSTVALNLALAIKNSGLKVGLLDADIYGPSMPMMLGISSEEKPYVSGKMILPLEKFGLKIMSMGFLAGEDAPVIWRGPMVSGILQQFLVQVEWGELDYLVIDLPPGTGDAQLTLTQQAHIDGAVIVTQPQDVALLDARRGLKMFEKVGVKVIGIVENMSFLMIDGQRHPIFGEGGGRKIAAELDLPLLQEIPIDPRIAMGGDSGKPIIEAFPESDTAQCFSRLSNRVMEILESTEKLTTENLFLKW